MDFLTFEVTLVFLLQLCTILLVANQGRRVKPPEPTPEKEKRVDEKVVKKLSDQEKISKEVQSLKKILSSQENLKEYADLQFRGNVEKAKKEVQGRLKKLTGEVFEVPLD